MQGGGGGHIVEKRVRENLGSFKPKRSIFYYCGLVFTSSRRKPPNRLKQNRIISVSCEGSVRKSGAGYSTESSKPKSSGLCLGSPCLYQKARLKSKKEMRGQRIQPGFGASSSQLSKTATSGKGS